MSAIRGTIREGKVVFENPPNWPEGKKVFVVDPEPAEREPELTMLTEEEQGDDPESIAAWLAWFDSLEPLVMSPEEEAGLQEWKAKMKAFNVEAVRRQMEDGIR